jgi:hypothetical protein
VLKIESSGALRVWGRLLVVALRREQQLDAEKRPITKLRCRAALVW